MRKLASLLVRAAFRAVDDLAAPPLRRIVVLSTGLTCSSFVGLWIVIGVLLGSLPVLHWRWINWSVELLGATAVAGLSWLLFPAVATIVMGFFLDRIAGAVEARDYPGSAPPRPSLSETGRATVRLMALTMLLNLLALPVYVLAPTVNVFVFIGLNGYLFGREYFEVVALRRLDPAAARTMRRRFAGAVFVGGLGIVGLFAVPIVNLVAPVLGTAFMVHLFEGLRHIEPPPATV